MESTEVVDGSTVVVVAPSEEVETIDTGLCGVVTSLKAHRTAKSRSTEARMDVMMTKVLLRI